MNLHCILVPTHKMVKMQFNGGMRNARLIHAYTAWHSTISQFQVWLITYFCSATSVDVECLFSHGCLILSHTCSRLSVSSTCTLLCLGSWSKLGLVQNEDVEAIARLDEADAQVELNKLGDMLKAH
jgi:hypothetical protein